MIIAGPMVFTMNDRNEVFTSGCVRISDVAIAEVSSEPLEPSVGEEVVDGTGLIVMPGLINTHQHMFQALLRDIFADLFGSDYLAFIYRSALALLPEDSRISGSLGALSAVRSGVTTVVDHHFLNPDPQLAAATLEGMREVGVRSVLARTTMDMGDLPSPLLERPADGLAAVDDLMGTFRDSIDAGLVHIWTGPNTPGVNSSGHAAVATREFAMDRGIRRSSHIAEYKGVTDSVRHNWGVDGVVTWLDEIGALGQDLLAVHAVHVPDKEVAVLAASGASVSHNPYSNLGRGDRYAPVSDYLSTGMAVGLGTDGAANNDGMDILDVISLMRKMQRSHATAPTALTPIQALRMATIDGARAIGLQHLCGSIEPGKRADLVLLDSATLPRTVPVLDPLLHLVHSSRGTDVRSVMVDGRWIMRDREIATVEEPAIYADAQKSAMAFVDRLS